MTLNFIPKFIKREAISCLFVAGVALIISLVAFALGADAEGIAMLGPAMAGFIGAGGLIYLARKKKPKRPKSLRH